MNDTLTILLSRIGDDWAAIIVELLLIGLCINWSMSVLQGTRGTRPLRGVLVILIVATVVVRVFGWQRLELLYRYVLISLSLIALVVFQPELRRAVIRLGDVQLRRQQRPQSQLVTALVKAAGFLSRNRYGALVAIQRDVDLTGWAENGTMINAEVSANLLNTIFFPNSPLHDLGVIIRGTQVVAANCQFPSPDSDEIDAALGSRHLAAVGMSYETDALVLVVSEETGVISLADNGKLTRYLTLDDLTAELELRLTRRRAAGTAPAPARSQRVAWQQLRRPLMVVPLTLLIWYLADQATLVDRSIEIELNIRHDDPAYIVDIIEPQTRLANVSEPQAILFSARLRGPARAIDQLTQTTGGRPLTATWVLPPLYALAGEQVVGPDVVSAAIGRLREIQKTGLAVEQTSLTENLRLRVDKLVSRQVPVQVTGEKVPLEVERIEPATVEVRVRTRQLAELPAESQLAIRAPLGDERLRGLEPGSSRTFDEVGLAKQIGTVGVVRAKPDRVSVTVRAVTGQHQLIRNVVVHAFLSPEVAERYDVEKVEDNEWRIDVDVAGKEAQLAGLRPTDIGAFVHITSDMIPPTGEAPLRLAEVTIIPPEGVTVTNDKPRTVRVKFVPRTGASATP